MKFLLTLLAKLPLRLRARIGRICGGLFSYVPTKERRVAELQMKVFLGERFSPSLLREVYKSLGQVTMESINLRPILNNLNKFVECDNWQLAERVTATGRPIICLTAHLGNWDLLAAYCIKRGVPITTIGREARVGGLQDALTQIRESYGIKTIWRSDKTAARTIMQELKDRRVVAALIDQDTDVSSAFIPFFGTPVRCPSGLVVMAKRMNAIVTAAFLTRVGFCRYKVSLYELDGEQEMEEILAEYHSLLEKHIRENPEQWVWVHKRWRSLTDGSRLSSRDYINFLANRLGNETFS